MQARADAFQPGEGMQVPGWSALCEEPHVSTDPPTRTFVPGRGDRSCELFSRWFVPFITLGAQ